ncbi:hypothetical protein RS130_07740 [Paraglaciecola aquimarina]|uniref:Transposon Tn7 transposition protein TnsD C-termianl domain-containing protein n=1 Tax=Paraglaciecola aquimarina TaxID=1235557 RepID=A0ABU3SV73_9ALTE|nr:hypothetical protein [Paraglaciecola aquimarina]MDU0353832.1 hypothetical protein [Paraglaciecola aquimarina]
MVGESLYWEHSEEVRTIVNFLYKLARESSKDIRQKRIEGAIYAIDHFEQIPIPIEASSVLIGGSYCLKKYRDVLPKNFKLLIETSGTIKKAIIRVEIVVRELHDYEQKELADYIDGILLSLKDIKTLFIKTKTKSPKLPICALCWREVDYQPFCKTRQTEMLCKEHSTNKSLYHTDRKALKLYCVNNADKIPDKDTGGLNNISSVKLFGWIKRLGVQPSEFLTFSNDYHKKERSSLSDLRCPSIKGLLPFEQIFINDWSQFANLLIQFVKLKFPNGFKRIKFVNPQDSSNWFNFANKLRYAFDPKTSAYSSWLNFENNAQDVFLILTVISRYETYCDYKKSSPKRQNSSLRKQIKKLAVEQLNNGEKLNFSRIAKQIGVTRQRVSVLAKELGLKC